jgi:hypothetical protein
MWPSVAEQVFPDLSNNDSVFLFTVEPSKQNSIVEQRMYRNWLARLLFLDCLTLKVKIYLSFEMSGTARLTAQCHVPEDCCKNLESQAIYSWIPVTFRTYFLILIFSKFIYLIHVTMSSLCCRLNINKYNWRLPEDNIVRVMFVSLLDHLSYFQP